MTAAMTATPPQASSPRRVPQAIRVLVLVVAVLLLLPYALTPLYRVVDPVSTLMLWRWAKRARVERTVVPLDRIAPILPRSVIAAEDDRFCSHHGIDFDELRRVVRAESNGVRRARGGSSITQQLAKNLFLWPGRSYVRKALEIPLALWIDLVIPKRRQMEIYLNVAEWGPNGEFGAEAGAAPGVRQIRRRPDAAGGRHDGRDAAQPDPPQRQAAEPRLAAARRDLYCAGSPR